VWATDMAAAYDKYLGTAVFAPYAEDLAARVARQSPRRLLELAAGTGVLTRAILQALPEAHVTATDLNVAMVAVGAAHAPRASWQPADAMRLPFHDASFDLVACQFGVMFFPDRPVAYAEVARVLTPGGCFLFNCWGPLHTHEVETAVMTALAKSFPDDPPNFLTRVPHGYHDADRIRTDLATAGFGSVRVEMVELLSAARSAADLATGYCRGTPLRGEIESRGDLDVTIPEVAAALERQFGSGPILGRMAALVISAYT
jgi:SAM-dependent methyltransferase